jgi:hypothetical protein
MSILHRFCFLVFLAQYYVDATSGSYAPSIVPCPSNSIIRFSGTVAGNNQSLNSDEQNYVKSRELVTQDAFRSYFSRIKSWNATSIISAPNFTFPRLAIASSGGGKHDHYQSYQTSLQEYQGFELLCMELECWAAWIQETHLPFTPLLVAYTSPRKYYHRVPSRDL